MSGISKRVSGSWVSSDYGIMKTSTDTIATLPTVIYANDTTATIGLKGQMEQSGSPSPSSIIMPSECGDLETTGEHVGQYKIPISSANVITPVYLGEVETTRRIRKLVLTGEEIYISKDKPDAENYMYVLRFYHEKATCFCSHLQHTTAYPRTFKGINSSQSYNLNYMCIGSELQNAQPSGNTVAGFREYLAAQYAAGTPVTIWYVLAEPETAVVNEPIRKIGDYADVVSGISVPTISGADTLSVDTTLQPSEVTVYYKGWHPATVHECTNDIWT